MEEGGLMKFDVDVVQKRKVQEYWVLRGIKEGEFGYKCVAETELELAPTIFQIGNFLAENPKASFCSIEHNYRFVE
jgi:hypothetical protein